MIRVFWSFRTALAWLLTGIAFVAFSVVNESFATSGNLYSLLQIFSVLAIVSCGLACVMIAGEFDLSIAGVFPLSALIAVKVGEATGVPAGILTAVAASIALGAVNGFLTGRFNIPSLAVTVGTLVMTIGIGFALAGDEVVTLTDFGPGVALDQPLAGVFAVRTLMQVALAVIAAFMIARTWLGLATYAIGSDRERASVSGLSVVGTLVGVFVISGLFTGIAGALQGVALASGQAGSDEAILLQAVTAAIIGGISISGGKGSLSGVIGGALLLATVSNGLSLQGTSTAVIQLVNGAILLVVVLIDRPLDRRITRTLEGSRIVASTSAINAAPISKGSTQ